MYSHLTSAASALPELCLSNEEFIKKYELESSSEWIKTRTGIEKRHFVKDKEEFEAIVIQAAKKALNVDAAEVDGVICATSTNFSHFPGLSQIVHNALGLPESARAFDLNAACNGFMVALSIADNWIRYEGLKNILVIGAEAMSSILDMQDRATSCLFGDGAGAVMVSASEKPGMISWAHKVQSSYHTELTADKTIKMNGRAVFENAVKTFEEIVLNVLEKANYSLENVDLIIPHQANSRIFESLANRLKISNNKIPFLAQNTANTSAATIPIALSEIEFENKTMVLVGFGAGFTSSAVLII